MTRYRFTTQALNDLFDIWSYIAQDSAEAAERVEEAIYDHRKRRQLLRTHPVSSQCDTLQA